MDIERETLVEIIASAAGAGVFIIGVIGVGLFYGDQGLSGQGALALIAVIVGFIVLMTGIGYWLSGREA